MAPAVLIHHMHYHVNGPFALILDIVQRDTSTRTTHRKLRQAPERISGAIGMNRCKRSAMACIQSIEEDPRLGSTNFAYNDPVGPVTERSFEQVGEANLTLVSIELGFGGDDMRLPDIELGYIFQDQDAVAIRDE